MYDASTRLEFGNACVNRRTTSCVLSTRPTSALSTLMPAMVLWVDQAMQRGYQIKCLIDKKNGTNSQNKASAVSQCCFHLRCLVVLLLYCFYTCFHSAFILAFALLLLTSLISACPRPCPHSGCWETQMAQRKVSYSLLEYVMFVYPLVNIHFFLMN